MSTDIVQYTGTATARAKTWASLSDVDLRRDAIKAATERDSVRLWSLTEAFVVLHGRSGARVSPHTIDNYQRGVRTLLEHWQGENVLRPGRDAPLRYVRELEDEGLAPGSISVKLASARTLYKALRWAGATDAAPFADVKAPKDPTPAEEKRQAYADEAIEAMLKHASTLDRVLILLGAHGGLRIAEILGLRWTDLDLAAGTLKTRGKGRKRRTVNLSPSLVEALSRLSERSASETVIPYRSGNRARQRLQRLCKLAGVKYLAIHSLRHSCGTQLYRISSDLRVAAAHLGHSSTETTQIYAKMDRSATATAVQQLR
jgi:site-specific recombinase XerC